MKVYKNVQGRLGNQMFQYASTLGILHKNNIDQKIRMNFSDVYKKDFQNDLRDFKLTHFEEVSKIELTNTQKIMMFINAFFEKILLMFVSNNNKDIIRNRYEKKVARILSFFGIYRMVDGYYDFSISKKHKNIFVSGSLESPKYFDEIRDIILEEFTPRNPIKKDNLELYNYICETNSVCVSVRRGDFLDKEFSNKHFVCNSEYFEKAIKKISEILENPSFIFFSDDIDWCKNEFKHLKNVRYESGKDPVWEKMRLMYSCKHFIISNSTFSWWCQYLSRNINKIVIAPKRWKNFGYYSDIYQEKWILID